MPKPFDRLGERLLAAGFAPGRVRRYLAELDEHLDDLKAEAARAGHDPRTAEAEAFSRLGAIDDLAQAMTARRELRSWTARAPWAAFVLAPTALLAAIFALTIVLIIAFVQAHRATPDAQPNLPGWFEGLSTTMLALESLVLPILLGWAAAAVAIRQRITPIWPAIGLAVIAIIGATSNWSIQFPAGPGTHGELSFGMHLMNGGIYRIVLNLVLISAPYIAWHRRSAPSRVAG